jgi:uncharacterized membrane protein YqiK
MEGEYLIILVVLAVFFVFILIITFLRRYRRCPSDKILVVMGKSVKKAMKHEQQNVFMVELHLFGR